MDLEVLGRVLVGNLRDLLARVAEDDLAVVAPRRARRVARGRWQRVHETGDERRHALGELAGAW